MKKSLYLLPLCITFIISSCKKPEDLQPEEKQIQPRALVYSNPTTPYFDWETTESIKLTSGNIVKLPWVNGSIHRLPDFIYKDYKRIDGWELLYNFCNDKELGKNYLIFYNKLTGILRVYYYLEQDVTKGDNTFWKLSLTNTNKYLNSSDYFSLPLAETKASPMAASTNICTGTEEKAINPGWNAFDTEIAYDGDINKSIEMAIQAYNIETAKIELKGNFLSKSEGTIISTSQTNPLQNNVNNISKAAGKGALEWAQGQMCVEGSATCTDKSIKVSKTVYNSLPNLLNGGVSSIVKAGINLIFGSFIGRATETKNTEQKLTFTTNGEVNLTGSLTSTTQVNVRPLSNIYFPGTTINTNSILPFYNKTMGVWNIEKQPIIRHGKYYYSELWANNFKKPLNLDSTSIKVVFNPEVLPFITRYEYKIDLLTYRMFKGDPSWRVNYPNLKPVPVDDFVRLMAKPYYLKDVEIYADKDYSNHFFKSPYLKSVEKLDNPSMFGSPLWGWGETITVSTPLGAKKVQRMLPPLYNPNTYFSEFKDCHVVKVTVTIYPKAPYDTTPIVMTRSYLPGYDIYENQYDPNL